MISRHKTYTKESLCIQPSSYTRQTPQLVLVLAELSPLDFERHAQQHVKQFSLHILYPLAFHVMIQFMKVCRQKPLTSHQSLKVCAELCWLCRSWLCRSERLDCPVLAMVVASARLLP